MGQQRTAYNPKTRTLTFAAGFAAGLGAASFLASFTGPEGP